MAKHCSKKAEIAGVYTPAPDNGDKTAFLSSGMLPVPVFMGTNIPVCCPSSTTSPARPPGLHKKFQPMFEVLNILSNLMLSSKRVLCFILKKTVMKKVPFIRIPLLAAASLLLALIVSGCEPRPEPANEVEAEPVRMVEALDEDMGPNPWVLDIEAATLANPHYRIAVWTGPYMQMVLMTLQPGESIDLEVHEDHDQFIRIEQGQARVLMGQTADELDFDAHVEGDWAIMIPAGYWHEIRNTGDNELKLYTLYAPSEHPAGTLHETYEDAAGHY